MKAKLFICHHPGNLLLYKNLAQIIKQYDKDLQIILFKVNHPYFSKFNFEPYKRHFDQIIEFDFIHYKKNFFKGLWKILIFQKRLKKAIAGSLKNFKEIDLFLDKSTYLPINILLYNLSRQENVKNITKFSLVGSENLPTKVDKVRTFLCALYSLFFKCYKIKALSTLGGRFLNFVYTENTPGTFVKIISPIANSPSSLDDLKENILPYPVIFKHSSVVKKDMVIVFGKKSIFKDLAESLPIHEICLEKLTALFNAIANQYSDCELYYKPHPVDKRETMPGIDIEKYSLLDGVLNAQELFDKYQGRIKAVYAFSSSAVIHGSFFGIPSYTFYRYLCNRAGIETFDSLMSQDTLKSKFLFHLSNLNEVGKIDNLKSPNINSKMLEKIYRKVLSV